MQLRRVLRRDKRCQGMSLCEIAIAMGLAALGVAALIDGYVLCARQAEMTSLSLAAQAQALERMEEVRAAKYDLVSSPPVIDVAGTNFLVSVKLLDVPLSKVPRYGTNFTTISDVVTNDLLKQIRVDCVWSWIDGRVHS